MSDRRYPAFSLLTLLSLLVGGLFMTGCFDDNTREFDTGRPRVAFAQGFLQGTGSVGEPNNEGQILLGTTSGDGSYNLTVQLVGAQRSEPTVVAYQVDDSTTAEVGEDFTIAEGAPTGTVTIPADSSSATIDLSILDGLTPNTGESEIVYVSLIGATEADIPPAENYKTYVVDIGARRGDLDPFVQTDDDDNIVDDSRQTNFGIVAVGSVVQDPVFVANFGNASLNIESVSLSDDSDEAFTVAGPLGANENDDTPDITEAQTLTAAVVQFAPEQEGTYSATVVIQSNEYDNPSTGADESIVRIPISGTAVASGMYRAELQPLNGYDDVEATATFTVDPSGGAFAASMEASNVAPNTVHPQHIHAGSECPAPDADENEDGFVDVIEGVPTYGPILLPLDSDLAALGDGSFPAAGPGGSYSYSQTADLDAVISSLLGGDPGLEEGALGIQSRHVVLHGVAESTDLPETVQSLGDAPAYLTLPVACGQIERIGDVEDDDDSDDSDNDSDVTGVVRSSGVTFGG